MTQPSDEHVREHIAEQEFQMPAGFQDGPPVTMSPVIYWWLSMTELVAPEQVQQMQVWRSFRNTAFTATADGFDADRWDIIDDWCARAFKDMSAAFPEQVAKVLRTVARLRTFDAVEDARRVVQGSDDFRDEERGGVNGKWTRLFWALDGYALFVSQYARPLADRHPEVLRSAANVGLELFPLRKEAPQKLGIMDLFDALVEPKRTHKRSNGKQSARTQLADLRRLPF